VESLQGSLFKMEINCIKPLRNFKGHFIHNSGFVFYVKNGKDISVDATRDSVSNFVYVNIRGKQINLLYLMIENFLPTLMQHQHFKYSIQYGSRIPAQSIKISDVTEGLSDLHIKVMADFSCRSRSDSANLRTGSKISPIQIANVLIKHSFLCIYCGETLNNRTWHLDHFIPISKHGLNSENNIVPSCARCNLMKSNIMPKDFYDQCRKIADNHIYRPLEKRINEPTRN